MTDWANRYREEMLSGQPVITGDAGAHHPGKKIARAITEIQEKVVTEAALSLDGLDGEATVEGGVLTITLSVDQQAQEAPGLALPDGGEPYMVLTRTQDSSGNLGAAWDWVRAVDV
jgi:hypothetical protein